MNILTKLFLEPVDTNSIVEHCAGPCFLIRIRIRGIGGLSRIGGDTFREGIIALRCGIRLAHVAAAFEYCTPFNDQAGGIDITIDLSGLIDLDPIGGMDNPSELPIYGNPLDEDFGLDPPFSADQE